jgi:nucleotide-binding universal stress UspA family protein
MKYLFCTDGSKNSFVALEAALELVKNGFEIDIFYLKDEKNFFIKLYNALTMKIHMSKDEMKNFHKIVAKAQKIIQKHAHFMGDTYFRYGDIDSLINHINDNFYNMLIFGSHNYTGIKNQLFGFSRKILDVTETSAFIYRGSMPRHHAQQKKHFLLCIDETYQTLNAVISFMKNFNTENDISLITVTPGFFQYSSESSLHGYGLEACLDREILLADKKLDEIERILCHNGIIVKSKIHLRGNPSEEILDFMKQDFDLLVLGSHARQGVIEFLFGSVSKNILDYSNLPILVIPTKTSS